MIAGVKPKTRTVGGPEGALRAVVRRVFVAFRTKYPSAGPTGEYHPDLTPREVLMQQIIAQREDREKRQSKVETVLRPCGPLG